MTIENYNSVILANKSLLCVFCKQKFSINAEIMNLKFYNVSKLFLSIECNYKYAYKGALRSHKSIHIKEKLLDEKRISKGSKAHANINFLYNLMLLLSELIHWLDFISTNHNQVY